MRPRLGREKIQDAALALFAKRGFHGASISDIAQAAGVSKGLTYNYFASKEELLLSIVEKSSQEMFALAETLASGDDYVATLRDFLDAYAAALREHQDQLIFQLSLLFQPDLRDIVKAPLETRGMRLLGACEAMFRNAGIPNPTPTARRFISELDGIALHHLTVFQDFPLDEMLEQLFINYRSLAT